MYTIFSKRSASSNKWNTSLLSAVVTSVEKECLKLCLLRGLRCYIATPFTGDVLFAGSDAFTASMSIGFWSALSSCLATGRSSAKISLAIFEKVNLPVEKIRSTSRMRTGTTSVCFADTPHWRPPRTPCKWSCLRILSICHTWMPWRWVGVQRNKKLKKRKQFPSDCRNTLMRDVMRCCCCWGARFPSRTLLQRSGAFRPVICRRPALYIFFVLCP